MKRVALLMLGIDDISGGGGAERQFSSFFDNYTKYDNKKFELFLITDKSSLNKLRSIGNCPNTKNIIILPNLKNSKLNFLIWNMLLIPKLLKYNINLLHITLASYLYLPFLYILNIFKNFSIKIILNLTDCTISYNYFKNNPENSTGQLDVYKTYFNHIKIDGIYSWYEHFRNTFRDKQNIFKNKPYIESAKYCFTDFSDCEISIKENIIVYAGRLIEHKQPFMFLKAIDKINKENNSLLKDWEIEIYGKGILEEPLKKYINDNNLNKIVTIKYNSNLKDIFAKSKLFVSTQNLENFTSLSMLEAMACGNIIISRDVGQTNYFVKNKVNGFLLEKDTIENLSEIISEFLKNEKKYLFMHNQSIKIAREVHNINNFTQDIESYWQNIFNV